jgi:urease accessory protein
MSAGAPSAESVQDIQSKVLEDTEGWKARLRMRFSRRNERTRLVSKSQSGPLTVQRPFYPEGDACHLYLLHPPGGVVGGDRLQLEVKVDRTAHVLLTTPGAGKFYRSSGPIAGLEQRFEVSDGASLEWLPQETILFDGAKAELHSQVTLHADARFIGWEVYCLGRPAAGERFANGQAVLRLALHRNRKPLLLERLDIQGLAHLDRSAGLRGHPVTATLLALPADRTTLDQTRSDLAQQPDLVAGATLLDDLLVVRCLGYDSEPVKRLLEQMWRTIRPGILGLEPCTPRVWAT